MAEEKLTRILVVSGLKTEWGKVVSVAVNCLFGMCTLRKF